MSHPGLAPALQEGESSTTALCCSAWALPAVSLFPFPRSSPASPPPMVGSAPVRTAKAERRHQERLRMQSPELPVPERALSPAERRALEAEKRALWRAAR